MSVEWLCLIGARMMSEKRVDVGVEVDLMACMATLLDNYGI
jgi:hypothetical protein